MSDRAATLATTFLSCRMLSTTLAIVYNVHVFVAILQTIIKERRSSDGIMMKLYELYPVLCSLISSCPETLSEPLSHALLAFHPFLSNVD